jgi:hypothetical protein
MDNAPKNEKGQFLDPNTGKPIEGKINYGHKYGYEYWREADKAEKEGLTQKEFNDRMNNPKILQIEDESSNKSHTFEMPRTQTNSNTQTTNSFNKGRKPYMKRNGFLESIKADKATIDRCNEVSKNAAKKMNSQSIKKSGLDNGGRERGDTGPMSNGRESGNKGGLAPTLHSSLGEGYSSNGKGDSRGNSFGGQASSSRHSSAGSSSSNGHSSGSSGTDGHGSGGQIGSGGHESSGGSGGHGGH